MFNSFKSAKEAYVQHIENYLTEEYREIYKSHVFDNLENQEYTCFIDETESLETITLKNGLPLINYITNKSIEDQELSSIIENDYRITLYKEGIVSIAKRDSPADWLVPTKLLPDSK